MPMHSDTFDDNSFSASSRSARAVDLSVVREKITTALAAVAFQDHLVRSLSLGVAHQVRANSRLKSSLPKTDLKTGYRHQQREYVLDSRPPPLTLAQRYGLVDAPKQLLTEDEWKQVKEKAKQRHDFKQPCVICKEDLGSQPHVLLSCTHVFHKNCIQSFERFTGRKSCPMCRKEQYQTRVIHDGKAYLREKSATIIQSAWRGFVVKSWYKKLRQTVPPNDSKLRAKFFEEKLKDITDRMVKSMDHDVNSFLFEIDQSLEVSRDVFRHFDDMLRVIPDTDWQQIETKAKERADVDCPICLMALHGVSDDAVTHSSNKSSGRDTAGEHSLANSERQRNVVLLSCSHSFHATCLLALEEFTAGERPLVCPVCRAGYTKKLLS